MKSERGLTLVEVVMVISIAAVVFLLFSGIYKDWQRKVILTNQAEELRGVLLRAQQLSLASAENTTWGVHLEDDRYVLFPGSYYNENHSSNKIWILDRVSILNASTTFWDGVSDYGADVVFSKFAGQTNNTGTISMFPNVAPETIETIEVRSSGQID